MRNDESRLVHIKIPIWLWNRIKEKAKNRGQSASSEIRSLLIEEFGDPE